MVLKDSTGYILAAYFLDAGRNDGFGLNRLETPKLTSDECLEVAEYLITESQRLNVRLDMRMLVDKAFPDFLQHREGDTEAHWKDLILTSLEEQMVELNYTKAEAHSRQARKEDEHDIIREITAECDERDRQLAEWSARTGKSERAFYRRLKELGD